MADRAKATTPGTLSVSWVLFRADLRANLKI